VFVLLFGMVVVMMMMVVMIPNDSAVPFLGVSATN
jgi:hypothetical protein